jgi:hypothetical protein
MQNSNPTQQSKVSMALEVIRAMHFLGIDTEKYSEMKVQFGGLAGLHNEMSKRLGA